MSAYQIDFDGQGHRVFLTSNGIDKQYLGPRFATPRQAIAYSDSLTGIPSVSPLSETPTEPKAQPRSR